METSKYDLMKATIPLCEKCGDRLSTNKRFLQSYINKSPLLLLIALFLVSGIQAQTIMSFQNAMQTLEPSAAAHLESLVTEIHPTAYLTQGEITTYGEGSPVVAFCDAASIDILYGNDPVISQAELINITLNSINNWPVVPIDLTQLEALTNLKYLLIVFEYDACSGGAETCLASLVEGMVQGISSQITVIYQLSIPQ